MTDPDELRQLADRLTDLADGGTAASTHSPECWRYHEHCAYHAAAVALCHHADLLDAIGDPEELRQWRGSSPSVHLRRITAAVEAARTPNSLEGRQ